MTRIQAERITGLEIREIPIFRKVGSAVTYAAYDGEVEIVRQTQSGHKLTIKAIVDVMYRRTSRRVFEEQEFKCFVCGYLKPLTADHIHPRAHGRIDQRYNLRGVCPKCHLKITDNIIVDPKPHPVVLAAVQRHGWTWEPDSNRVGWHQLTTIGEGADAVSA